MQDLGAQIFSSTLSMGPACSGSHLHKHNHAFCTLVHGVKHWLLVSPTVWSQSANASKKFLLSAAELHPRDYLQALSKDQPGGRWWAPNASGLQACTQQAGDFLFIPNSYLHQVINVWPSIAINSEFQHDGVPEVVAPQQQPDKDALGQEDQGGPVKDPQIAQDETFSAQIFGSADQDQNGVLNENEIMAALEDQGILTDNERLTPQQFTKLVNSKFVKNKPGLNMSEFQTLLDEINAQEDAVPDKSAFRRLKPRCQNV